ncbi:SAVED domain-containing protein [Francisella tularensis subsp. novicida]|uniref:SAVED domain-containing protein n=1 Tax=Francisella tularensis TaxID=263 RepID=UPI0008FD51B2|nr:SAVED domain-containing protein [Francisella tularensis]APC94729.1 hypothetical protein KX02_998 [Francisella tularensis subsp. novicida]MBK2346734.1 SAVED domain-containing protein [Francisella tularensis subsp. novicida]
MKNLNEFAENIEKYGFRVFFIAMGCAALALGLAKEPSTKMLWYYIPAVVLFVLAYVFRKKPDVTLIRVNGFMKMQGNEERLIKSKYKNNFVEPFNLSVEKLDDPEKLIEVFNKEYTIDVTKYLPQKTNKVIIGKARIPFLFIYGYMLRECKNNIGFIETVRDAPPLLLKEEKDSNKHLETEVIKHKNIDTTEVNELACLVSITGSIKESQLPKHLIPDEIVEIKSSKTGYDQIRCRNDIDNVAKSFRENLLTYPNIKHLHLFISAPTSVAIRLGMEYQEGTMPEISIYNYNSGEYNYCISIDKQKCFKLNHLLQ